MKFCLNMRICIKCFWNQFKTEYLQGLHTKMLRISRPCCTPNFRYDWLLIMDLFGLIFNW